MSAGYSGTPLAKKLGIKAGDTLRVINSPADYRSLFTDFPQGVINSDDSIGAKNIIHFFTKDASELVKLLPQLKTELIPNGMIWVSWPKKASKIVTDVDENLIRNSALAIGLVDVKVCAIDDVWSGLKLVIPVKDRKTTK